VIKDIFSKSFHSKLYLNIKNIEFILHHTDHTVKYISVSGIILKLRAKYISVRVFGWLQMKSLYLRLYRFSKVLHPPDGCKWNETGKASSQTHTFIQQTEKVLYSAIISYVFIGLTQLKKGSRTMKLCCGYPVGISILRRICQQILQRKNFQYRGPTILE
jgi:hypothetical protein